MNNWFYSKFVVKNLAISVVLMSLLTILTAIVYSPGLNGDFLFDDIPNLKALGDLGGVTNWDTFLTYLAGGFSGPTGRPLSLLSFLLNDNAWPSLAASFKYTNLCLHLICGLLLFWATYLLLRAIDLVEQRAVWIAAISAGLWLLHPYWVSTTLYVVQRMTILSNLFMLAGMVAYLKGRSWLMQPTLHRPRAAYLLMTGSAGLGTLLAVLSKENGALLPLLLLVLEVFLHRMGAKPTPRKVWLSMVLGVPAAAVLAYLAAHINFSPNLWPTRPFDQVERLYSETRIMWDYLGQLWMPRIEGAGLFQDGFEISRRLTQPISTLWATLGWVTVILALPFLYRRLPFVWLAIVFFLCGHLIESTVIGLELYFEHRNYGPAQFMFLPLTIGIDWLGRRYRPRVAIAVFASLITMLAGMTWQRSTLWADNDRLQAYWATSDPQSARGRNYLIGHLMSEWMYAQALTLAEDSARELPNSSLMTMTLLRTKFAIGEAVESDFEQAADRLAQQTFDAQTVAGLRELVDQAVTISELSKYRLPLLHLLDALGERGPYKDLPLFKRVTAYNKARLYLAMEDMPQAQKYYAEAIERYGIANSAMQMFAEVANSGHLDVAQRLLDRIRQGVDDDTLNTQPMGRAHFQQEIDRMQATLASHGEDRQ